MTKQEKLDAVKSAYTTIQREDKTINIIDDKKIKKEVFDVLFHKIQQGLEVTFEISYDIMSDACSIVGEKTLDELVSDNLDFNADADSIVSVYTNVQLSYLSVDNEVYISWLMQDEAITSIAQACAIWYSQKVVEACEALKSYILE